MQRILRWITKRRPALPGGPVRVSNLTRQVDLANRVDVANSSRKRRKGLLGRNSLAPDEGMWIVPCEAVHTFGMRFSIDLLYLDRNNIVLKIRHSVPPWRMSACLSAHSILELASGTLRRTGTQPGDKLCLGRNTGLTELACEQSELHASIGQIHREQLLSCIRGASPKEFMCTGVHNAKSDSAYVNRVSPTMGIKSSCNESGTEFAT